MNTDFSRNLIKGKIAEVVFEQMIREEERYTIIPFGYEHTMPTLSQYQDLAIVKSVMKNIKDAPDFVLISNNKSEVHLVEVKFRKNLDKAELIEIAKKLLDRWEYPWLFVATPKGFYCSQCKFIKETEKIDPLPESWVTRERQNEYLKLLNEFEK